MKNTTFGEKLKELRKIKKLTQPELAALLNVSNGVISFWENDINEPKLNYIIKISTVLGVSADYLLGLETEEGIKTYTNYGQDFRNAKFKKSTININSKKE